jgi:hypothetical protein
VREKIRSNCFTCPAIAHNSTRKRLNADLKQEMGKQVPVRTKAKLREAANSHMMRLEQNSERYFIGPEQ